MPNRGEIDCFVSEVEAALSPIIERYNAAVDGRTLCSFFAGALARFAQRSETPIEDVLAEVHAAYSYFCEGKERA